MPSEDRLIRLVQQTAKSRGRVRLGIGDDAAVLKDGTVVTTDAYADGVHFDLSYMTLRQVGERCTCGAISDVVAMAAEPEAVFVSLVLPRNARCLTLHIGSGANVERHLPTVEQEVRQLYSGIESVCAEMGCEVAGGDIIVAERLLLALTATGKARSPKLRSGARPGDKLYVTGQLGSAEAGRLVLADEVGRQKAEAGRQKRRPGQRKAESGLRMAEGDWRQPLVRRHLRPIPRLAAMRALRRHFHGLIDTSDGLATDARHLCAMSGVKIVLEADALPVLGATKRFCAHRGVDPTDFVLGAGEDYELLFTNQHHLPSSVKGVEVTMIGRVESGRGLWMERAGRILPVTVMGYDHLRPNSGRKTCY
jgi:thiamine-monophosphate kinase